MKKFICIGLCIALIVCFFAPLTACSESAQNPSSQYQKEIEELRKQLEEQQQKIDDLQQENNDFKKQLADIELQRNAPYGTFCSLETAYDLGYLTKDDLMCIASIQNEWSGNSDESDQTQIPEEVSREIRETAAYSCRTNAHSPIPQADYEDIFIDNYYGCYDGIYAVMVTDKFSGYDTAVWDINVGGVTFRYSDGRRISLYLDNDDNRSLIVKNVDKINVLCQMVAHSSEQTAEPQSMYLNNVQEWQSFLQEHPTDAEFSKDYNDEYFSQKSLLACLFPVSAINGTCVYVHVCSLWNIWYISLAYKNGPVSESGTVFVLYEIQKSEISDPPRTLKFKTEII